MSYPQKKPWQGGGGSRQFSNTPYQETFLDDRKLRLSAPAVSGRGRRPALFVTVVGGNPRINVYTEVENDKNGGKIVAKKDALAFMQLLECLEHIVNTPETQRWVMDNKAPDESQGDGGGGFQKKGPPVVDSKTVVGRNEEGAIYISVVSADKERPKIIFEFGNQYYHTLARRDSPNESMDKRATSEWAAKAWLKLMREAVPQILVDMAAKKASEKAARKAAEGGGGDDGFRKQSNGPSKSGGGSSNSTYDDFGDSPAKSGGASDFDFDDDLPM